MQSRRKIGGLADDRLFLGRALADQIANDDGPAGDADSCLKFDRSKATDSLDRAQSGPDCPFGIVLVGSRIAEIDQHAVAHILRDKATEPDDGLRDRALIAADHLLQILRINPGRKRGGAD